MRAFPEEAAFLEAAAVASCQEEEVRRIRYRHPHRHLQHSSSSSSCWFQWDTFPEVVANRKAEEPFPVAEVEASSQVVAVEVEVE